MVIKVKRQKQFSLTLLGRFFFFQAPVKLVQRDINKAIGAQGWTSAIV
jgi:hypothetical protein